MRASTIAEREARGRAAREHSKRSSHRTVGELHRNPIELLKQSSEGRVEKLVPLRYGRMSVSPFTFFRGTAIIQAHDLSRVPDTGLSMPICGDGHLMNFGGFATPERQLVFDLNDFDEVAMGPFEWDLKRLTASLVVAARHMRLSRGTAEHLVMTAATEYRDRMAQYAQCGALELWYDRITFDLMAETALTPERRRVVRRGMEKAAGRTHESLLEKMAEFDGNRWSIRDAPPGLFHVHGVNTLFSADDDWFTTANWSKLIERTWSEYLKTLSHDRRELLSHFTAQDLVFKVVGVGSVGTRCLVLLIVHHKCKGTAGLHVEEGFRKRNLAVLDQRNRSSGGPTQAHGCLTGKPGEVSAEGRATLPGVKSRTSRRITSFNVLSSVVFPAQPDADRRINGIVRRCAPHAQFKLFPGWWKEDRKHAL